MPNCCDDNAYTLDGNVYFCAECGLQVECDSLLTSTIMAVVQLMTIEPFVCEVITGIDPREAYVAEVFGDPTLRDNINREMRW